LYYAIITNTIICFKHSITLIFEKKLTFFTKNAKLVTPGWKTFTQISVYLCLLVFAC